MRATGIPFRDDIKSSGIFAIFTRLKLRGQRHIMDKLPLKIQTAEDIDVKMTWKETEIENKVL